MGNETSKKDEQVVLPKYENKKEDCMAMSNWADADKDIAAMKHKLKKQLEVTDVARKYDDPTFIMMKNGENVGKVIGANKDELKSTIEKLKPNTK
ncbi:hypothetical protein ACSBR1_040816 [Camellia fascicularis]